MSDWTTGRSQGLGPSRNYSAWADALRAQKLATAAEKSASKKVKLSEAKHGHYARYTDYRPNDKMSSIHTEVAYLRAEIAAVEQARPTNRRGRRLKKFRLQELHGMIDGLPNR